MNTVKFGELDSYADFGLLLRPKDRPKPKPKTNYISVPGRSGDLDATESLGEVAYENLTFPIDFYLVDPINEWDSKLTLITNALHGKKMRVTFSDDPDYYYTGRVTVNNLKSNKRVGELSLDCNFEPYKLKQEVTTKTVTVEAGGSYTFENDRMTATPTLTLSAAMTITYNGKSYALGAGSYKSLDIQFKEGANVIGVETGSGTITATWQEGAL